jgi:hypothetical protein
LIRIVQELFSAQTGRLPLRPTSGHGEGHLEETAAAMSCFALRIIFVQRLPNGPFDVGCRTKSLCITNSKSRDKKDALQNYCSWPKTEIEKKRGSTSTPPELEGPGHGPQDAPTAVSAQGPYARERNHQGPVWLLVVINIPPGFWPYKRKIDFDVK